MLMLNPSMHQQSNKRKLISIKLSLDSLCVRALCCRDESWWRAEKLNPKLLGEEVLTYGNRSSKSSNSSRVVAVVAVS